MADALIHVHSTQARADRAMKQQRRRRTWSSSKRAPTGAANCARGEQLQKNWQGIQQTAETVQRQTTHYTSAISNCLCTPNLCTNMVVCGPMSVCHQHLPCFAKIYVSAMEHSQQMKRHSLLICLVFWRGQAGRVYVLST